MDEVKRFRETPFWDELLVKLGNPCPETIYEQLPDTPLWDKLTGELADPLEEE